MGLRNKNINASRISSNTHKRIRAERINMLDINRDIEIWQQEACTDDYPFTNYPSHDFVITGNRLDKNCIIISEVQWNPSQEYFQADEDWEFVELTNICDYTVNVVNWCISTTVPSPHGSGNRYTRFCFNYLYPSMGYLWYFDWKGQFHKCNHCGYQNSVGEHCHADSQEEKYNYLMEPDASWVIANNAINYINDTTGDYDHLVFCENLFEFRHMDDGEPVEWNDTNGELISGLSEMGSPFKLSNDSSHIQLWSTDSGYPMYDWDQWVGLFPPDHPGYLADWVEYCSNKYTAAYCDASPEECPDTCFTMQWVCEAWGFDWITDGPPPCINSIATGEPDQTSSTSWYTSEESGWAPWWLNQASQEGTDLWSEIANILWGNSWWDGYIFESPGDAETHSFSAELKFPHEHKPAGCTPIFFNNLQSINSDWGQHFPRPIDQIAGWSASFPDSKGTPGWNTPGWESIDLLDIITIVNCITGDVECLDSMDVNNDGSIDLLDIILLVNIILQGRR